MVGNNGVNYFSSFRYYCLIKVSVFVFSMEFREEKMLVFLFLQFSKLLLTVLIIVVIFNFLLL